MNNIDFTFPDTIAGYVTSCDKDKGTFSLKTTDGREFQAKLTDTTYAEVVRNLGESFQDPRAALTDLLTTGRYVFAYGVFYPEAGENKFEAKRIVFTGRGEGEYRFEAQDWWVNQIRELAEFYINAQFPSGEIDYRNYRTHLTLEGQHIVSTRQETDTISRMIYGFASAYMLTGEDRYLEAAEKGTEYLRNHMRAIDEQEGFVYWYHAVDTDGKHERKILASQFGDDFNAIPAYEQIYALAGPIQTYRVTGDPRILTDAEMTLTLFDRFFKDEDKGGFFSHVDPINFDPRAESLTFDCARKNWNSVGDHAPAYLINLYLATGDERHKNFLIYTADTIEKYFQDYGESPFVQEKFHEDWSHDTTWGWQQNRGVVGHNLKIAWNLMRVHHLQPNDKYTGFARRIAEIMPSVGMDRQRGGWYDVLERLLNKEEEFHRYVWHDRKAWWQQEQAILAYLILAGSLKDPEHLRLARESAAFYNAWFMDHDSGGVYFNVLSCGLPYLLGTERLKGSHSMSGYHSFELCYLAAVYTNLLITKHPMDFYFKPKQGGFKDNVLRVQPDLLPPGSVRIGAVWIDGNPYYDFDADAMTINLPALGEQAAHPLEQRPAWAGNPNLLPQTTSEEMRVRVRIVPTGLLFNIDLNISGGVAELILEGNLDDAAEPALKMRLDKIASAQTGQVILQMSDLQSMSKKCARSLAFMTESAGVYTSIQVVGATPAVKEVLQGVGFLEAVTITDK